MQDKQIETPESSPVPGERRRRQRAALWFVIVLAAASVVGFYAVHAAGTSPGTSPGGKDAKKEDKAKEPVPVSVAAVASGPVSSYISATANLIPDNEVEVLTEAEGRVARLLAEEGDWIQKGQALVVLHRDDAEIALKKSQVREANAILGYERGEKMNEQGLISQVDFDKLRMERDLASQEVAEAQLRLSKTTIRAPFSGRITLRSVEAGQHVRPGDSLFKVADFDPLIAAIHLPEKDVLALKTGRTARITLKADEAVRFNGRIRQISPVVDLSTGTVKVTVEALRPFPTSVRPGGFVTIDIVRETRPGALLLPRQAVLRELQTAHVFVAKNGLAEKRTVTLGLEEGERVEIRGGVAAGEKVIVAGQGSLRHGSPVRVL
jgi:membrane fusion protein (multidrug efflux system)